MPKHALSERNKCSKKSNEKEERIQEAVEAYQADKLKPADQQKGYRKIAELHNIPESYNTIRNQANGMRSTHEAHQDQQKLTASEEEVLVHFLEESADRGFPQSIEQITTLATAVRHAHLGPNCPEIGGSWAGRFLNRHCVLRHGRDVHPTWVKSSIETLSNTRVWGSEYKGKVRRGL